MTDPDPDVKYAATLSLLELAGEAWLEELSGVIGRTSGVTREQVLRGFFHATNYLKIDVGHSRAADLMMDALETALLDDLPAARMAAVWPLAWMRHPRAPAILRRAYRLEQDGRTKAHIVRVAVSLMAEDANPFGVQVADELLRDALQCPDERVRLAGEEILASRGCAAGMV